jgi:hypothetical protein
MLPPQACNTGWVSSETFPRSVSRHWDRSQRVGGGPRGKARSEDELGAQVPVRQSFRDGAGAARAHWRTSQFNLVGCARPGQWCRREGAAGGMIGRAMPGELVPRTPAPVQCAPTSRCLSGLGQVRPWDRARQESAPAAARVVRRGEGPTVRRDSYSLGCRLDSDAAHCSAGQRIGAREPGCRRRRPVLLFQLSQNPQSSPDLPLPCAGSERQV